MQPERKRLIDEYEGLVQSYKAFGQEQTAINQQLIKVGHIATTETLNIVLQKSPLQLLHFIKSYLLLKQVKQSPHYSTNLEQKLIMDLNYRKNKVSHNDDEIPGMLSIFDH